MLRAGVRAGARAGLRAARPARLLWPKLEEAQHVEVARQAAEVRLLAALLLRRPRHVQRRLLVAVLQLVDVDAQIALGDAEIFLRFRAQNRDSLLCQDFFIFTQTRTLALIGATRVSSITKNDVSFPKRARVHNLRHRPR